jgi:predicted enzyme related to lactoylglutathione lyase
MFQALRRIHVAASDFTRSRRFYSETLGLPEFGSFEKDWVEYGLGPVLLKLTPLRSGEVPARNQVAFALSTDSLESTLSALKERGVTVTRGPGEEFTGRSAEILDPDGYRIVVFQASDLHPDEEWVPMSRVDEAVRQKLGQLRAREKSRMEVGKKGPKRPAPKKKSPPAKPSKKPSAKPATKPARPKSKSSAKPAAKRPAKPAAKKKPAPKKPSKKPSAAKKKPAPKKAPGKKKK